MSRQATIHASMDAVMQAFLETPATAAHMKECYGKADWLRDFRTVGFFIPRQTGATSWMLKKMLAEPDSMLFSKFRENYIVNFDANGVCDVMQPKQSMLSEADQAKIREPIDLSLWIKRKEYRVEPLKLLIFDFSSSIFNNIRINKFHEWLERSPGITHDTVIIRIN
ncbi:hypothetical protein FDI21_gp329 [Pseudomonas phage Noxifer]|uniref:Uncharacterized protein n=1 Tax=Pseudomonas phage Noxifer TaxID=2006684 RepID=A0A1Y0SV40_9CAUD|nr:hypothetical protein FDI21_gp329 [Pseudomonas phage Noxifer]ARV77382.1 hypothetical protein NOXIFER_216 [Pseudomonas phage Noxifer]